METQTPPYVVDNFPQIFKTLTSIPPNSEPIDLENPQFHPSSSRNHSSLHYHLQFDPSNAQISRKFKSTAPNVVIYLNDDDFGDNGGKGVTVLDDNDDDDDCVLVKREKNLTPRGNHKKDPICVEEFQTANPKPGKNNSIGADDYDDGNDEIRVMNVMPWWSVSSRRKRKPFSGPSITEKGESSGLKKGRIDDDDVEIEIVAKFNVKERKFNCEICADSKARKEAFRIKGCFHTYCSECMRTYVASKLQDGVSSISCPVPSCVGVLEPEYCREILPLEVFVRWGNLLCESVILASQKFYCPFKDCSALLVDDGCEKVTMSECPSCFRLFCAQCKVAWHMGIECAEYLSLSKDEREKEDIMLMKLAKSKNWQRCPKCKYYVEKSEGCLYMKCRCGIAFCYSCGAINTDHRYHNCKKCGR